MNNPRLQSLVDRHFSGMLEDAERAELERELLASPATRAEFWQQARFHALLARWGQETCGRRLADDVAFIPLHRPWWRKPRFLAAAAAATILAAAGLWQTIRPPKQSQGSPAVAVLTTAVDASWNGASASWSEGTLVPPGPVDLVAGLAQIEFFNGTRMIVEGPARFDILDDLRTYCHQGRLRVHVSESAKGFTIDSSAMKVVDHGTEFAVHISTSRPPEVHVFDGLVETHPAGGTSKPVRLAAGGALRVLPSEMVSIPLDEAAFPDEQSLAKRAAESSMAAYATWKGQAGSLSDDPATLLHLTLEDEPTWSRTIANQARGRSNRTDIVGCQWTTGRWPGKQAIQLRGRGDRLRIDSPGALPAFSLVASIRIDSLPNGYHALLSPDTKTPGAVRWGISHDGCVRLAIALHSGKDEPNWQVVMSPPIIGSSHFGLWVTLASTFDGREVRHYLNGSLIATGAARSPTPPLVGRAEIGNWIESHPRNLPAAIDEFLIIGRVLGHDEIRRFAGIRDAIKP
jgi:hypothetical protein